MHLNEDLMSALGGKLPWTVVS